MAKVFGEEAGPLMDNVEAIAIKGDPAQRAQWAPKIIMLSLVCVLGLVAAAVAGWSTGSSETAITAEVTNGTLRQLGSYDACISEDEDFCLDDHPDAGVVHGLSRRCCTAGYLTGNRGKYFGGMTCGSLGFAGGQKNGLWYVSNPKVDTQGVSLRDGCTGRLRLRCLPGVRTCDGKKHGLHCQGQSMPVDRMCSEIEQGVDADKGVCGDWTLARRVLPRNKDRYKYFYPKNFPDAIEQCKQEHGCVGVGTYNGVKFAMFFYGGKLAKDRNDEWTLCAHPDHI